MKKNLRLSLVTSTPKAGQACLRPVGALGLVVVAMLMVACGQRGPLVMPGAKANNSTAPVSTEVEK